MPSVVVQADKYGKFIKVNGYIIRPETPNVKFLTRGNKGTDLPLGIIVHPTMFAGSIAVKVTYRDLACLWFVHGEAENSEDAWDV